jgi:hypothetical protein
MSMLVEAHLEGLKKLSLPHIGRISLPELLHIDKCKLLRSKGKIKMFLLGLPRGILTSA